MRILIYDIAGGFFTYLLFLAVFEKLFFRQNLRSRKGRMLLQAFLLAVPFALLYGMAGAALYGQGIFSGSFGLLAYSYGDVLFAAVTALCLYGKNVREAVCGGCLASFLGNGANALSAFFAEQNYDLAVADDFWRYTGIQFAGTFFMAVLLLWIFGKLGMGETFQYLMEQAQNKALLLLGLPLLIPLAVFCANRQEGLRNANAMTALAVIAAVCFLFAYGLRSELQRKQLAQQEMMLNQQNLYIGRLENLQQELKLFRHDLKNLAAGMYGEQGGSEAELALNLAKKLEDRVGSSVSQFDQLRNVHPMGLKNFLLIKLAKMEKRHVRCNLEVLYPVEEIALDTAELYRALGVLLDNAVEAVEGREDACFDFLIVAASHTLSFVVQNPVGEEFSLEQLQTVGGSSKGKGRGLGLQSYRRIVDSHPNLTSRTEKKNGKLIQEFVISRNNGRGAYDSRGGNDDTNLHL